MSIASIAAQCDLPQGTVSRWCRGLLSADAQHLRDTGVVRRRCERCGVGAHDGLPGSAYAYLLGIYLGDGCLGTAGKSVALRIVMDAAYPAIIDEVAEAILTVRGEGTVSRHSPRGERCVALTSYTRAWLCLFPQHGSRPQAPAADLARALAAIHRQGVPRSLRARADPVRRLARRQSRARQRRDYEYPRLPVLQSLRRYPARCSPTRSMNSVSSGGHGVAFTSRSRAGNRGGTARRACRAQGMKPAAAPQPFPRYSRTVSGAKIAASTRRLAEHEADVARPTRRRPSARASR